MEELPRKLKKGKAKSRSNLTRRPSLTVVITNIPGNATSSRNIESSSSSSRKTCRFFYFILFKLHARIQVLLESAKNSVSKVQTSLISKMNSIRRRNHHQLSLLQRRQRPPVAWFQKVLGRESSSY